MPCRPQPPRQRSARPRKLRSARRCGRRRCCRRLGLRSPRAVPVARRVRRGARTGVSRVAQAPRHPSGRDRGHARARMAGLLGPDVLVTRPPGYVLQVEPERIDAACFERLLETSRRCPPEERCGLICNPRSRHRERGDRAGRPGRRRISWEEDFEDRFWARGGGRCRVKIAEPISAAYGVLARPGGSGWHD